MRTTEVLVMAEKDIEGEAERRFIRRVIEIGDKFDDGLERIRADPYKNGPGKQHDTEVLARMTDAELGVFDAEVTADLEQRMKNMLGVIEAVTAPPAPDGDGIKAALSEATRQNLYSEIRRNIESLGLDALGREEAYARAESPEARAAMETAPPRLVKTQDGCRWEPWVRPELIVDSRMGRAAGKNPEAVAALRTLQSQRATHKHFVGVLRSAMRKVVPLTSAEYRLRDLDGRDVTPKRMS